MLYEIIRRIYTTHGCRALIGYIIRDVRTGEEHIAVIKHGQLEGYISLDDVING